MYQLVVENSFGVEEMVREFPTINDAFSFVENTYFNETDTVSIEGPEFHKRGNTLYYFRAGMRDEKFVETVRAYSEMSVFELASAYAHAYYAYIEGYGETAYDARNALLYLEQELKNRG